MVMGALSGYVAVTICYPTDVIRRNYQVSILKDEPTNYIKIFKQLYNRNGLKGFYAGLIPTYWKVLPSVALAFTINDYLKEKILKK
jgi:solute carrier family 25 (mitochondrial phosphate transporter), member 23/24/25/41